MVFIVFALVFIQIPANTLVKARRPVIKLQDEGQVAFFGQISFALSDAQK